jgi:dienelactone hydrolase
MLAIDWLLAQPDVDPKRVELVGVSLGAPFACITGALDGRATRVWSLHGGGDPYALIDHNLRTRVRSAPARHLISCIACLFGNYRRLAPERWVGRIAPRPLVLVNAYDDERIPRACVDVLWNAARDPKEQIWIEGRTSSPNASRSCRSSSTSC